MATVTQTLSGQISGINVSSDGKIYTTLEWVDLSAPAPVESNPVQKSPPQRPRVVSRTSLRIESDRIFVDAKTSPSVELPAGTIASVSAILASIKSTIDAAILAGKIKP